MIRSYAEALAELTRARTRVPGRKPLRLPHTALVRRSDTTIAVEYTGIPDVTIDLVTFDEDGTITLDTKGYRTNGTKSRIYHFTGYHITVDRGVWTINHQTFLNPPTFWRPRSYKRDAGWLFKDGMTVRHNVVTGGGELREAHRLRAMRRALQYYANRCIEALGTRQISGERLLTTPCMYCSLMTKDGRLLSEVVANKEHLIEHVTWPIIIPAIICRAALTEPNAAHRQNMVGVVESYLNPIGEPVRRQYGRGYENPIPGVERDALRKSITRYLGQQLGLHTSL